MKRQVNFWPKVIMLLLSVMLSGSVIMARKAIRRMVTDAADVLPLPAVSIIVKGTTVGTAASQGWQVERVLSCAAWPATSLEDSRANKQANKLTGMAGARGHRPCGQLNNCMFPGV
jgi:hypothetical protein